MTVFTLSNEYSTIVIMFLFVVVTFFFIENRYILLEMNEQDEQDESVACTRDYRNSLENMVDSDGYRVYSPDEIELVTADAFYPLIFMKCAERRNLSGNSPYDSNASYESLSLMDKAQFQAQFSNKYDAYAAANEHGENGPQSCTIYREHNFDNINIDDKVNSVCNYLDNLDTILTR